MEYSISDGNNGTNSITREQMVTILYRYAQMRGYDTTTVSGNLQTFRDSDSVSAYAVDAMTWAVGHGIINGIGDTLSPQGTATRAQVATVMARFCTEIVK